ncbi:113aa long hypothetical protein [Pyrococcus horikoshii OT3]|uniref:Uncharacterized protein n=1 Tax=Pyrococcus horikoshii (strain ATCC 700860 / DSM 12428 / JCM 9974 / NBRC 100139 / OT-3) TaxID=70601 RepID=O59377_PYRHO|nr:113aa long hypothetical protein [Pyrococcus horikoshii OT3]
MIFLGLSGMRDTEIYAISFGFTRTNEFPLCTSKKPSLYPFSTPEICNLFWSAIFTSLPKGTPKISCEYTSLRPIKSTSLESTSGVPRLQLIGISLYPALSSRVTFSSMTANGS